MLLNGKVAWNICADIDGIIREQMNNSYCIVNIAELRLNGVDPLET